MMSTDDNIIEGGDLFGDGVNVAAQLSTRLSDTAKRRAVQHLYEMRFRFSEPAVWGVNARQLARARPATDTHETPGPSMSLVAIRWGAFTAFILGG